MGHQELLGEQANAWIAMRTGDGGAPVRVVFITISELFCEQGNEVGTCFGLVGKDQRDDSESLRREIGTPNR